MRDSMPSTETMSYGGVEQDLLETAAKISLTDLRGSVKLGKNMSVKPKRAALPTTVPTETPVSMKDLFEQRDATQPGSKEEDQTVDRIMEAMFPGSHASS
jgi:hypothetical protein